VFHVLSSLWRINCGFGSFVFPQPEKKGVGVAADVDFLFSWFLVAVYWIAQLLMTHASKESSSTFLWRVVGFVDS
jgi:hypothetical protein